jgi:hypothetical protein
MPERSEDAPQRFVGILQAQADFIQAGDFSRIDGRQGSLSGLNLVRGVGNTREFFLSEFRVHNRNLLNGSAPPYVQ